MRLLNIFLVVFYLSVLLADRTRSAAQDWADTIEAKFSHSQTLISQPGVKLADAEAPKEPENKTTALLSARRQPLALIGPAVTAAASVISVKNYSVLASAPRAPPQLA